MPTIAVQHMHRPQWQPTHRNPGQVTGGGAPLHAADRQHFEAAFGADFGTVRVHSGNEAQALARQHSALAFAQGEQIVLGRHAPTPGTPGLRRVLAHELTHVLQHRQGGGAGQSNVARAEAEATRIAGGAGPRGQPEIGTGVSPDVPLRFPDGDTDTAAPQLQQGLDQPGAFGGGLGSTTTTTRYELTGFGTDSDELTSEHQQEIQRIADALNAQPLIMGGFVTIWGFADRRGEEAHNDRLGQQRADAVRAALLQLVTDSETRSEIRAYSFGEPEEGPETDDPSLRKVEITVTRRQLPPGILSGGLTLTPPGQNDAVTVPPPLPGPQIPLPPTGGFPPWMWQNLQPPNRSNVDLNALSRAITDGLRQPLASGLAPLARGIANAFGANVSEAEVRRWLDDQMVNGGEAGLRAALRSIVTGIAGSPSTPPPLPYGPNVREVPGPRIFSLPPIRF